MLHSKSKKIVQPISYFLNNNWVLILVVIGWSHVAYVLRFFGPMRTPRYLSSIFFFLACFKYAKRFLIALRFFYVHGSITRELRNRFIILLIDCCHKVSYSMWYEVSSIFLQNNNLNITYDWSCSTFTDLIHHRIWKFCELVKNKFSNSTKV